MNRILGPLGRHSAAHPWRTILLWVVGVAAVFALASAVSAPAQENWDAPPGTPSQRGVDLLRAHLPEAGNASAQVVVHEPAGEAISVETLSELDERLGVMPHVLAVDPPRVSEDRATVLLTVRYDVPVTHRDLMGHAEPLQEAVAPTRADGLQVALGGELPATAEGQVRGTGELIGIVAALTILLLMFRSVVAAGLPVLVAVGGLAVGGAGITVLCGVMDVSPYAPMVASMVGLGVGIDYALLLLTRTRDHLAAGLPVVEASERAAVTAGRSVVLAGTTVLVSLLGLRLAGLPTYSAFGFATAITVLAVMVSTLVLVPALCGLLHRRLLPRRVRRGLPTDVRRGPTRSERWAHRVAARPLAWALAAVTVMLLLAAPVLDMRTWPQSGSDDPTSSQARQTYDLLTGAFGPGAPTPYLVVADRTVLTDSEVASVVADLEARDDLVNVAEPLVSPDGGVAVVSAESTFADNDARTPDQVASLRAELPDGAELAGSNALYADFSSILADKVWLVIGFVVGVSMLLLLLMFRSPVVAVKAALMNLLSVGAAYGVVTAVFQWGWGLDLLGVDHALPMSSWLPILMFAILFGLSMDYEVFLLSRIREDYDHTGDARGSVARGLAATSGVISAAAAIMVLVFLGFVTESGALIKMLGFGLGVAIFLDATVVRLVLVPATMSLLGERNWWTPAWLDRLLPRLAAETGEEESVEESGRPDERVPELVRR
jgi:putative drug exporter of the RND superfamily